VLSAKNWIKYDEFATNDSPVVQSRKYLEDYEKAKDSGQPLSNDHVRIALEAKRQLGLPIDESDYADLQTKETKLREVTNMENYVKNAASSYGRDSGAMMEEMLKLNGCSSVAELQEKVANGEKIIEAVDTAWSKDIQKQHYAGYDAMIAARNAEAGRAGQAGSGSWYEDVARSNNGGVNLSGILNPNANYSGNSQWRANTESLNIGSGSGYWIEPNPDAPAWAMNFDFGRDFGARAGQHFSNGEYAAGALNLMAGTGEAFLNTGALVGAAFLGGVGVNAAAPLLPVIQNNISNITILAAGVLNGLTPSGLPSPVIGTKTEILGIIMGVYISERVTEDFWKLRYDFNSYRSRLWD